MKRFYYKVYDEHHQITEGIVAAQGRREAAKLLTARRLRPITVRKEKRRFSFFSHPFLKDRKLSVFSDEWASLLEAGLPLTDTLSILQSHGKRREAQILEDVKQSVSSGGTVSGTMRETEEFPIFFSSLLYIGEISGTLPEQLHRLSDYYQERADFREKWTNALAYPLFALFFAICLTGLILIYILPNFAMLFETLDIPLPPTTEWALRFGEILRDYGLVTLLTCAMLCGGAVIFFHSDTGKNIRDSWLLRSHFVKRLVLIRFCFAAAALLKSGKPLSETLFESSDVMGNREAARRLAQVGADLKQGRRFSESLSKRGMSFPVIAQMVKVGMESGELPKFLAYGGRILSDETERKLKTFRMITEPTVILFVGGLAALLIFSVMIPVFTMAGSHLLR